MRIQVKLTFEIDVKDWYSDEKLTKKQKLKRLEQDFDDISVWAQHCNYETQVSSEVKEIITPNKE